MANNEEKIAIVKSPCYIHNKKTVFKNCMTRSEAIEKIAKVFCRADADHTSCADCAWFKTKKCTTFLKDQFLGSAEAALDALLGKEAENGK